MYTDENSDKDSDCGQKTPENSPNITKKSWSTIGFRNTTENQNVRPLAVRAAHSFTGTVDDLKLCGNLQRINLSNRTNEVKEELKTAAVCPCGCLLRPATTGSFRTREQNTLALHVVTPEVLTYHGHQHEPTDIAMFWKKDCRMFLWKGKARMKNVIHADSYKQ